MKTKQTSIIITLDSIIARYESIIITLDSINARYDTSFKNHMEEEAKCMHIKENTSIQTFPFPQNASIFEEVDMENMILEIRNL